MKTLIAYFSHVGENVADNKIIILDKGNTERVAEKIHSLTGGDLYKIEAEEAYPFAYRDTNSRAKREYENNERPQLIDKVGIDIKQYGTIYLGFPIWYRSFPRIIASFLDQYDLTGKTIIPFCTNDEEFFGFSLLELQHVAKDAAIKNGLVIRGTRIDSSDKQIEDFVRTNG